MILWEHFFFISYISYNLAHLSIDFVLLQIKVKERQS